MAIGSGLAAQVGYAPEVTFGTYVAASRFADATAVDLKKVKNTAQGGGYAAGRLVQSSARRVVTTQAAAGTLAMEVTTAKMGILLQHIMGGTVTPVQQASACFFASLWRWISSSSAAVEMFLRNPVRPSDPASARSLVRSAVATASTSSAVCSVGSVMVAPLERKRAARMSRPLVSSG